MLPTKAILKNYVADSFYVVQSNGNDKRYVLYYNDGEKIWDFVLRFIDSTKNEVLIKLRDLDDQDNPVDYDGISHKQTLPTLLCSHKDFLINDGFHQFMLRDAENGDYITLDEHALLFLYTAKEVEQVMAEIEIPLVADGKLIYEFPHWHYRASTGKNDFENLVKHLDLERQAR